MVVCIPMVRISFNFTGVPKIQKKEKSQIVEIRQCPKNSEVDALGLHKSTTVVGKCAIQGIIYSLFKLNLLILELLNM